MALTNISYASNEQTTQTFRGALKAEVAIIFPTVDISTSPAILFKGATVRHTDGKLYMSNGTIFEQIQRSEETSLSIKQKYESNPDTNAFTDAEKNKLQGLQNYDDTSIVNALANKVDKELGKGLSEENYTLPEKQKLAGLVNYDDTTVLNQLSNKVDKVTGKGLSTEDYTTLEKQKLASLQNYDDTAIQNALNNKVDKEVGKGLITDSDYNKLNGIEAGAQKNKPHTYTNDPATSSSATIPDFEGIHLYNINPENTVATLSRKLPENPKNWDSITIKFGGDITSGIVVTTFTLTADQDVLLNPAASAIEAKAGDVYEFVFYGGVWYGMEGDQIAITLPTVADIATYSATADALIIKDKIRGGVFTQYGGSAVADSGVIFADSLGRKWMRQIDGHVNIRWYDTTDMNQVMTKISTLITASLVPKNVYIPTGTYAFTDTYTFTVGMCLYGDGISRSVVTFPLNKAGFKFAYDYIYDNYTLRDFSMYGTSVSTSVGVPLYSDWDMNAHGITMSRQSIFERIEVKGFSGCGFYGDASVPTNNVNNSQFTGVLVRQNKMHGVYLNGSDSNAIKFINCDFNSNSGCGVYDSSFLGNHYIACHFATNGSPAISWGARGLCKGVDGKVYACKSATSTGVEPTVTTGWESNWVLTNWNAASYPNIKPYDSAITYIVTKSIWCEGLNQEGTVLGCYGEIDQVAGVLDGRMIVIGGNLQFSSGALLKGNGGQLVSVNSFNTTTLDGSPNGAVSTSVLPNGGGFRMYDVGKGVQLLFDTVTNVATLQALGSSELRLFYPYIYYTMFMKNGSYGKCVFGLSPTKPGGTPVDANVYLHANFNNKIYEDLEETILYKGVIKALTGRTAFEYAKLTGDIDYQFTTTDVTAVDKTSMLMRNYNFIKFEAEITAVDTTTKDVFYVKKRVKGKYNSTGAVFTLIEDTDLDSYSDTSMEACEANFVVYGSTPEYAKIECKGLAATTIKWNVRLKRTAL